jgi:hypothetical protein
MKMEDPGYSTFVAGNKKVLANGRKVWNYQCPCGIRGKVEREGDALLTKIFTTGSHATSCGQVVVQQKRGLTVVQKELLQDLFDQNFKTVGKLESRMLYLYSTGNVPEGFQMPPKKKLLSAMRSLTQSGEDVLLLSLKAVPALFKAYYEANKEPNGPDDMFVIGFHNNLEGGEDGLATFRLVFSTPRLLKYVTGGNHSESLHADDTHCNYEGFPLLMGGFTDANRVFTPVTLSIASNKKAEDYAYMFNCYKAHRPDQTIRICVCDGAQGIYNGMVSAYPEYVLTRVMCWMHAFVKNFTNKALRRIGTADLTDPAALKRRRVWKQSCVANMKILHQCSTSAMFEVGCVLWKKKYVDDMIDNKIQEVY